MIAWEVLAVVLVAVYVTWTAGRLDRMHARVDAAWAALDAQLVRRAFAAQALLRELPEGPERARLAEAVAATAAAGDAPDRSDRSAVENDLSSALRDAAELAPEGPVLDEARAAAHRVALARAFHNSAVSGTLVLRRRRLPRLLHLAGHRALPAFFDVDDTALS